MKGRKGFMLGISRVVAFTINWIPIPRTIRRIIPGIFEYLPDISKIYDRITKMQRNIMM